MSTRSFRTSSVPCRGVAVVLSAAWLLAACSGGSRTLPALSSATAPDIAPATASRASLSADANSKISIKPATLALLGIGAISTQNVTVSKKKYTGTFTEKSTCSDVATAKPASGKGPSLTVTLTGKKAGSCTIAFSDKSKNTATLSVSDTTASVTLSAASISPGSKSVTVVLTSVNGKKPAKGLQTSVTANLSGCNKGCSVAAPQSPPGSDAYSLTIFDATGGSGNQLATGTATAKIAQAKANTVIADLAKIPAYLQFGTVPSGTAGTPFASPVPLPLSVQDADHNPIAGTYSTPVTLSDSDTSPIAQGAALQVGSGTASRSVQLKRSSRKPNLLYGGLAIAPVMLTASASGVAFGASASFAPSVGSVSYNGPEDGSTPEIDLYSTTMGSPGNSGSFTLGQTGWSESPYNNGFTYTLGGANDNCTSFSISAPPSSPTTNFIIKAGASPVAGTCTLTATGATADSTVSVTLTYTTSGIGVYGKHSR